MSGLFRLLRRQLSLIKPYFPLSHGVARADYLRVISGVIYVIRSGLQWKDAPHEHGPHKTLYNRIVRWSRMGVFNKIFAELAAARGKPDRLMIDATHPRAHRAAANLQKKGRSPLYRSSEGRPELQASGCH